MKTIEQKAKAYDEIIPKLKEWHDGLQDRSPAKDTLELILPQFRESEDERIRKCICMALTDVDEQRFKDFGTTLKDCLAYLEKQKEQKPECPDDFEDAAREFRGKCLPPIEPISDELIDIIKGEFEGFRRLLKKKGIDYEPQRGYWEGFARLFDSSAREYVKEQKPAWSEEEVNKIESIKCLITTGRFADTSTIQTIWNILDDLRPSWKPSEEQMAALKWQVEHPELVKWRKGDLESLLEQLKKL